jgi:hypothetical protein
MVVYAKVGGKGYGRMRHPDCSNKPHIVLVDTFRIQLPIVHIVDSYNSFIVIKNMNRCAHQTHDALNVAVDAAFRGYGKPIHVLIASGTDHLQHSR